MKIDLNNKLIFFSLIGSMVFLLTFINNYLYYDGKRIYDSTEINSLNKNINFYLNKCTQESIPALECINDIQTQLNSVQPYAIIKIINENEEILLNYNNTKNRHLDRALVENNNSLSVFENLDYTVAIAKHSFPSIFFSTIRSMTFSIKDVFEKTNEKSFKYSINWYLDHKIYLRSRHVIIFFFFTLFIMLLIKMQQKQYTEKISLQERETILNTRENKTLKKTEDELLKKLQQYDSIINPPIDSLTYDDIINLDPESIIFKCRKVTEKLITQVYNKNIGSSKFLTLDKKIKALQNKNILTKKAISYAYTIKAFGNIAAHAEEDKQIEFSKNDALMLSNALILFIEAIDSKSE
ncbi:MAG: DUF4145 domain-containing protein [Sulfurimonas sp.]|nr:DUF4145 domain-containing protein [Sulfurimonas sp.]